MSTYKQRAERLRLVDGGEPIDRAKAHQCKCCGGTLYAPRGKRLAVVMTLDEYDEWAGRYVEVMGASMEDRLTLSLMLQWVRNQLTKGDTNGETKAE